MDHAINLRPAMRIALVGGCGGIGRAVAASLRRAGARLAIFDLPQSLAGHPPDCELAIALDATSEAQVRDGFAELAARWGALDGLVNLAGFSKGANPVAATSLESWNEVMTGNLTSAYLSCRHGLPLLHASGDAAVVNLASGLALKPAPGHGPYSVAKAGIIQLTRLLAQENAPRVRVNAVAPSAIDTAFLRGGTGRGGDDARIERHVDTGAYVKGIPMARIGAPEDVAGPILFLLSDAARYVTGQTLHVNGGGLMP
ncbi:MAG: SDR family oxidoreductase [Burkholderiales bacterium]|nr:SDR family oxidoreductase [Burkholderiales bacterium]